MELEHLWEQNSSLLSRGGLEIHTTIDPQIQSAAEKILKEKNTGKRIRSRRSQPAPGSPGGHRPTYRIHPGDGRWQRLLGDDVQPRLLSPFSGIDIQAFRLCSRPGNGYTAASMFYCEPSDFWEEGMDTPVSPCGLRQHFSP